MLCAFAAAAEPEVCLDLFNTLVGSGSAVDEETVSALLGALCEGGAWSKAVRVVEVAVGVVGVSGGRETGGWGH